MKAIILEKYGSFDTLKYEDIEKPVPKDNEVLIKIYASSVNFNILGLVKGKPFMARFWSGLLKPKIRIPGNDISGQVEAVGKNVTRFHPGDKIFGDIYEHGFGAFAEYVAVPENAPALKPSNLTFEEAGAVPESALVALHALRDKGHIQKGKKVLIYGASGGIGTFAVQIAKAFGAEVTGVCSTRNLDLVQSLGADHVIDYTKDDFINDGQKYDLIVSIAGYRSIFNYRRALSPAGIYVCIGGAMTGPKAMTQIFQALLLGPIISITGKKKLGILPLIPSSQKDLDLIRELIESGKVRPVIDRRFPLQQTAEALKYYEDRHSRGKIVIVIKHSD
ncbi:MAG: NAD(P)-dependent alcohol dehydrogenase [Bacteroidetes bacterium]|nr:NAD(P)-dependent alcohol dehydrogenase [Bacteroidota bacterium]